MARNFDLIVFDWDGTLMDSTAMITHSIRAASADLGLPVPSVERARQVIGLGLVEALQYAVPELAREQYPQMVERYRFHYLARDHELVLFEGVLDLLGGLRESGYQLAVATGKSRKGLDRALAVAELRSFFDATRTADETFSKPHPEMLLQVMDVLMVAPERTLMIGDTTHDLQLAANAGVAALAVSFGAHELPELEAMSPLAILHSIPEVQAWLQSNG
ncbi:HAD-IA family hydrolase [Niveibacterium sp. SC-1]|uniref:HAD-IA family hydrolase n=1 Tax=Niveibacterium sp. SC-1 TaxID=3135646 RepID=UPI00311D3057